ncbi:MAG: pyrroline-5-carboxylate reductase family protein [Bdellovibrionales bacterium]
MNFLNKKKFGFMGTGKMGQALVKIFVESQKMPKEQVFVTNRSAKKPEKLAETFGISILKNNEELVETCDVIFLCIKPQDMIDALLPIANLFDEHHTVVSLAAGISLKTLKKTLPNVKNIVRIMPNTPSKVAKGVVGYCVASEAKEISESMGHLLEPLGFVVYADEGEQFEALTVACGSGTGFVFELMLYWQDWLEERGFDEEIARRMTIQTFLGASILAKQDPHDILTLQEEVVSKKGVTAAGLDSMRELEIERLLRYSFEKAGLRDQEIGRSQS